MPIGLGGQFQGIYHRVRRQIILYNGKVTDFVENQPEIISVSGLKDPIWQEKIPADVIDQALEEIELIDGTLGEFSQADFLAGKQSPVTFGSAKQNFGVNTFLDLFIEHAPPPVARSTQAGEVDPLNPDFTGFVFKIQANMDKRHRDRIAFMRICSGRFERGMKVHHQRLDREVRLSFSNQFVAQDRETVDEAFAGDIVGIGDTGLFRIGDSVTSGKSVAFDDIPKFTPELFGRLTVSDAMKRKKLQKALQQLSEEGTIQLFIDPAIGHQDPIIGVVGELQFEVLLFRLEDEYGLDPRLSRLPYSVVRWPRNEKGEALSTLNGGFTIYRDAVEAPVILLEKEWDLNWATKENPGVVFATSIQAARSVSHPRI
jgi:peptide chain release factor 3